MDSGRGRGKRGQGRGARGKPRGRGRGRGRKARIVSSEEEASMDASEVQEEPIEPAVIEDAPPVIPEIIPNTPTPIELEEKETKHTIDMEADISQLEAPTFTTIQRNIPEPMLRLNWNHKVNLLGEKVMNPLIHICDQCNKPVLIYGRMIPCKHVFCFKCAKSELLKACPRCKDKVMRVEQTALGTVFMCSHGGLRHGSSGCRRTYLSQRDLNAHINHRHVNLPESKLAILESKAAIAQPHQNSQHPQRKDSLTSSHSNQLQQQSTPSNRHNVKHGSSTPSISVMQPTPRTNLANQPPQEQVQQSQGGYYSNNQQRQGYNSGSFNGNQQASQGQHDHDQHRPPAQNAPFYSSQYGQQSYNHSNNNNNSGHYTQQQQPQQNQQNQQWNQQQSSGYYR